MKKGLFLIVVVLMAHNLSGIYLTNSKTMDLTELRDAIDNAGEQDFVIKNYWRKFANVKPMTLLGNKPMEFADDYARISLTGAIGVKPNGTAMSSADAMAYLESAKNYLLVDNPIISPHYLDLDELWLDIGSHNNAKGISQPGGDFRDCLLYGSLLNDVAFIVDNLWYYFMDNQKEMQKKLDVLAGWAYHLLIDENFNGSDAHCYDSQYPEKLTTHNSNGRIRLAGALGYAGCVLGNKVYIKTAEDDLFGRTFDFRKEKHGFFELNKADSGVFTEGMGYTDYALNGLAKFFIARKRLSSDYFTNSLENKDWFADERVREIYINSLELVSPNMGMMPFDDTHLANIRGSGRLTPRNSFEEAVTFFYQSPDYDHDARNHIKWIINNYHDIPYNDNLFFKEFGTNRFYSYEYDKARMLHGAGPSPTNLSQGTFSNEEITILRRPILSYNDYKEHPVLIVNHENSLGSGHEHSDQSSFILYYKEKQLLTASGYRPSWDSYKIAKEWLDSPFSKNLIMVNPHHKAYEEMKYKDSGGSIYGFWEEDELNMDYSDPFSYNNITTSIIDYWNDGCPNKKSPDKWIDFGNPNNYRFFKDAFEPIGPQGSYGKTIPKNQATKQYLIDNEEMQHLRIDIKYDHPQHRSIYPKALNKDDVIDISRNFYFIDIEEEEPYFIIYDNVVSSDNSNVNEFMNQLHFALYPTSTNTYYTGTENLDISDSNGTFTHHSDYNDTNNNYNETYLHGTIGGINDPKWTKKERLPQGLYVNNGKIYGPDIVPPQWEHQALRVKTNTSGDEKFLTFLYPSEDGNSPITEIQRSDGSSYAVKAQHANETGYYVIGDAACDFNFDGNYFHVNGDFFAIKGSMLSYDSNDDVVISSIILNSGDHIECSDHTDSKSLVYYQSEEVYEELLASYTDKGELYITIKKTTNTQPRYKIFHQNISPENIFCKTVYDAKDKQLIEIEDNNISHLAYDDEYFYVNYSPEELANVNSVGELVMNRGYDRLTVETLKETTKSGFWKILDFIFCK